MRRWAALVLGLVLAGPAGAAEYHYVLVFASQRPVNRARHAHCFAAFARAVAPTPCDPPRLVETFAISWMPQTLQIGVYRLRPECGVNLDLASTLRWARADGQEVSMWGPFQIRKELYDRALAQYARLRSGAVRYKAVDTGYPTDRVSNCIHALSDLALEVPRLRVGTPAWGDSASYLIALSFAPYLLQPGQTHEWVASQLLGSYPVIRRGLDGNPSPSPLVRALHAPLAYSLKRSLRG